MTDFSRIKRGIDLSEPDVVSAIESRETTKELLTHFSTIARPNEGVAKVLLVFARMATQACDWLDGDLRVELVGDGDVTIIEVLSELGAGIREREFPPIVLNVPLAEFTRAVERVPHLIEPLMIQAKSAKRVVLSATFEVRRSSLPPAPIEIAMDNLFTGGDPLLGSALKIGGEPKVHVKKAGEVKAAPPIEIDSPLSVPRRDVPKVVPAPVAQPKAVVAPAAAGTGPKPKAPYEAKPTVKMEAVNFGLPLVGAEKADEGDRGDRETPVVDPPLPVVEPKAPARPAAAPPGSPKLAPAVGPDGKPLPARSIRLSPPAGAKDTSRGMPPPAKPAAAPAPKSPKDSVDDDWEK